MERKCTARGTERKREGESERRREGQRKREKAKESWKQEQQLKVKNVKAFVMSTSNNNKERDGMSHEERKRE